MLDTFQGIYLQSYYKKVFPSTLFCKWLSYNDEDNLSKREFSFTLEGDIYVRYQSFDNEAEFTKELLSKNPVKIDIGAVFNMPPKMNKRLRAGALMPEWKEFVLDIDMTDYDDVRFCCEKVGCHTMADAITGFVIRRISAASAGRW